ncbi:hypothetical protein L6452_14136 [Arctium lappa]|uniref:Uncharacterized protein n=1 Tax=Arctium lappa TaxID=4217 RepID=A0ACB9CK80_ARCLA|nr:hypothetical protein L6452_14136 [Arctium lappa]
MGGGGANGFGAWFLKAISRDSYEIMSKVVMLCWAIWKARNDKVWNHQSTYGSVVVRSSFCQYTQWIDAQYKESQMEGETLTNGELLWWSTLRMKDVVRVEREGEDEEDSVCVCVRV